MEAVKTVITKRKNCFSVVVTYFCYLTILPSSAPWLVCLMLGNLIKESGRVPNITDMLQNSLDVHHTVIFRDYGWEQKAEAEFIS